MSDELTSWDLEYLERMMGRNKNAGYVVETQSGLRGRTWHDRELINGKVQVQLDNGQKMLCSPDKLKTIGFID